MIKKITNTLGVIALAICMNVWLKLDFSENFISILGLGMVVCIGWLVYLVNKKQ